MEEPRPCERSPCDSAYSRRSLRQERMTNGHEGDVLALSKRSCGLCWFFKIGGERTPHATLAGGSVHLACGIRLGLVFFTMKPTVFFHHISAVDVFVLLDSLTAKGEERNLSIKKKGFGPPSESTMTHRNCFHMFFICACQVGELGRKGPTSKCDFSFFFVVEEIVEVIEGCSPGAPSLLPSLTHPTRLRGLGTPESSAGGAQGRSGGQDSTSSTLEPTTRRVAAALDPCGGRRLHAPHTLRAVGSCAAHLERAEGANVGNMVEVLQRASRCSLHLSLRTAHGSVSTLPMFLAGLGLPPLFLNSVGCHRCACFPSAEGDLSFSTPLRPRAWILCAQDSKTSSKNKSCSSHYATDSHLMQCTTASMCAHVFQLLLRLSWSVPREDS